jgi:2-methylcitrate dehydratase PrpD
MGRNAGATAGQVGVPHLVVVPDAAVSATRRLAEFVSTLDAVSTPHAVVHQAKRTLIDWAGVALAGSQSDAGRIAYDVGLSLGGPGDSPVVGRVEGLTRPFAALANGVASHALDYDDTFDPDRTAVHGSAPVWPAVLATGHARSLQGIEALLAFVAGFETEVRVALAAGVLHDALGWQVTGTCGHFGAAAATARALGLDTAGVVSALGSAGTQASGLKAVYGTMGKALAPGKAAMDGLLAAHLAEHGYTSSEDILEAHRGFLDVLAHGADPSRVIDDLGSRWLLLEDGFKAYASGTLTHPVIDALLQLRRRYGFTAADVERVDIKAHDYVISTTSAKAPRNGLEARFNLNHCVAVALLDGAAGLSQFTDERVVAADVALVRDRVSVRVEPGWDKDSALVKLRLRDGRVLLQVSDHNRGTPDNPMSDDELTEKFLDLASAVLSPARAREVASLAWRFEQLADVRELTHALRGDA